MSRLLRADMLLPLSIAAAAVALAAAELMKTFELSPASGDPIAGQLAGDRHGWAMLILAAFAGAALAMAIASGRRAWAWATAGCGIAALALFLTIDLPDANAVGDVAVTGGVGTAAAKAVPQLGFWLEAAAAIVLALAGIAYATQSAEQRQAPKRLRAARRRARTPPSRRPAGGKP